MTSDQASAAGTPKLSREKLSNAFPLGVALGLFLSCWNSRHDFVFAINPPIEVQFLSCTASFLGIMAAGLFVLFRRKGAGSRSTEQLQRDFLVICALQIICTVLITQTAETPAWVVSGVSQVVMSAASFVGCALLVSSQREGRVGMVLSVAIGLILFAFVTMLIVAPLIWFSRSASSLFDTARNLCAALMLLLPLAACAVAIKITRLSGETKGAAKGLGEKEPVGKSFPGVSGRWSAFAFISKTPWQLIYHASVYFFTFGVMHVLASGVVEVPTDKLVPVYLGDIAGALLFAAAFLLRTAPNQTQAIWPRIRAIVFPLFIASIALLPIVNVQGIVLCDLLSECAFSCYCGVFVIAIMEVAGKTRAPLPLVMGWAMVLAGLALALGTIAGNLIKFNPQLGTWLYSILVFSFFILLSSATLWMGNDRTISLVWGMEKKLPAKRHAQLDAKRKVEAAREKYQLTPREADILRYLVDGRSIADIVETEMVSINTIRTHVSSVHRKMDAHSNAEVVRIVNRVLDEEG